jgi:hypothetical protein
MNLPSGLRLVMPLAVRKMKGQASAQGMGRHSKDDVIEMGRKDLRAIYFRLSRYHHHHNNDTD